jgi:hypothetical protein
MALVAGGKSLEEAPFGSPVRKGGVLRVKVNPSSKGATHFVAVLRTSYVFWW